MNNAQTKTNLNEFCNSLVLLANLEAKLKKSQPDREFIEKIKIWSSGLFRLVVMGEVKKGKSSFINALLGFKDLVPVNSDIATSTIYKICYGEKIAYKVFFTPESRKETITISASELNKYGTEDGNPGNEKEVDFIQVFVPSALLKDGLVIIDTPGLGGLFKQHKRITYQYVPRADAVFMVSDSVESPIGQAELDFLADLQKITDKIYFVQTKAMAVGTEERQARERNNRNTLLNRGNIPAEKLRYFVVDSHLKLEAAEFKDSEDLADSGFIPLVSFINNEIRSSIQASIMANALRVALPKYSWVKANLEQLANICAADTAQKQNELQKTLAAADENFKRWHENLPRLQERFQDGIRQIKEDVQDYLKYCRPYGEMHSQLEDEIDSAIDMAHLLDTVTNIKNRLPEMMAEYKYEISQQIQAKTTDLLGDLQSYNISLNENNEIAIRNNRGEVQVNTGSLERTLRQHASNDPLSFDNVRTTMFGATMGMGIAGFAGSIIGSILPGIGTILGSWAGVAIAGAWGAKKSHDMKKENDLKMAKNQAVNGLQQTVVSAYQSISEEVQKILGNIERETFRQLQHAASDKQKELKSQKDKLQERHLISTQAVAAEKAKIEQLQKEFAVITNIFKAV